MVSARRFSALQYWTDQILVYGIDSKVEEYFREKEQWSENNLNKLAYACDFWRSMVRAKNDKDKEALFERFAGALTALSDAELHDAVMPNRLSILSNGDMDDYLSKARKSDRKNMGDQCFSTKEFRNFRYKVKDVEVNRADIKDCRYKVEYICPKGVIIRFEEEIMYLIERAVKKEQREEAFFPTIKTKSGNSKSLIARRAKIRDSLPWDRIRIESVARAVRFDPVHDAYVSKDKIVYVELGMSSDTRAKCREVGGVGSLAITAQSNLKQYVPADKWKSFQEDITKKLNDFEKTNKALLSPDPRTKTTKKLRKAYGDLVSYFGNPKNPVAITSVSTESPPNSGEGRSGEENQNEKRSDQDQSDPDGDVDMDMDEGAVTESEEEY